MNKLDVSETQTPIMRGLKNRHRDTQLADDALAAGDLVALRQMCDRLLEDRELMAKGMDAAMQSYALLRSDSPLAIGEPILAVERIAHEAIDFAREVLRLIYRDPVDRQIAAGTPETQAT